VEVAIHVADALAQVDVASLTVALSIEQGSPKDGDVAISFKRELDVLGGMREALAIPDEVA
jgi:hypothetical protein